MNPDLTTIANAKRQQARFFMPDPVTITDPGTITIENDGGTSIAGASSTTIYGRLARTGTQAVINEFGQQISAEADYILMLPHGTTIQEGWTVATSGKDYTVIAVSKPATWSLMVRAAIVSVTPIGG